MRLSPLKEDWRLIKTNMPVEGVVAAGHHVADLRAQNWKDMIQQEEEEVSESSETGGPGNTQDAMTVAATAGLVTRLVAILREEAAKANAALKAAREAGLPVPPANGGNGVAPPSANGDSGARGRVSAGTNDMLCEQGGPGCGTGFRSCPDGGQDRNPVPFPGATGLAHVGSCPGVSALGPPPPANGGDGPGAPSANGTSGAGLPSRNGTSGHCPPSANGRSGR